MLGKVCGLDVKHAKAEKFAGSFSADIFKQEPGADRKGLRRAYPKTH